LAANWSLGIAPTNNQSLFITNAAAKTVTIDATTASVTSRMTVTNLTIGGVGAATNTLSLNNAGTASTNFLTVLNGLALATNGVTTIAGSALEVRGLAGGSLTVDGLLTLNTGILIATNPPTAAPSIVGNAGLGILQLVGGIAQFNNLRLGNVPGAQGIISQSGGSLSAAQAVIGNNGAGTLNLTNGSFSTPFLVVGANGPGVVNQMGGTNSLSGLLGIVNGPGSGTYNLSGGILNAGALEVGNTFLPPGPGTFTQTGGAVTVTNEFFVGHSGSTNTYNLTNGSLSAFVMSVATFGTGVVYQAGGNITVSSTLNVGDNSSSASGSYLLSGGTLSAGSAFIGNYGSGTMIQLGGTNSTAFTLALGEYSGSSGTCNLTNGLLVATDGAIGYGTTGLVNQAGGTANFTNSLTLAAQPGSSGTYNLLGGTLTVGANGLVINSGGVFTLAGGTVNANATNYGTLDVLGPVWNGRITLYADLGLGVPNFTVTNGLLNFSTLTLTNGSTLTLNGAGLDNEADLVLEGGTLAGNGRLANNASLSGGGTIAGSAGFVNNALVTVSGGNLTLANTGANVNNADIDLAAGLQLRLTGAALTNAGGLSLNTGVVAGTAQLVDGPGGSVTGRGSITSPFNNAGGEVLLDSGTLDIAQPFSNTGTIELTALAANLVGGTITSSGTIQGLGSIGNNLANNGTVEAIGGTLTLSGSVNNNSSGLLTAQSGAKLLVTSGLNSQAGVISLSSGTFDNNGWPLSNVGQISGCGTFRSGGLANNGTITFSGGLSTINGNVTNQLGRKVTLAYNPAIFTGTVANNGSVKVTSTTATFAGTYIENGTFTSDPATNYFTDVLIGAGGCFVGHAGDLFSVSGSLQNGSLQNVLWDTSEAELVFRGGPSHTFYLPGADAGTNYSGLTTNFAWKTFRLGSGESLTLQDGNGTPGAGLYTKSLILEGGLPQISSITGNGFKIYYDPAASGNGYLGGATYTLGGGGAIIPLAQPTLQILAITRLTNGTIKLDCMGAPNQAHSVLSSTNLLNWLSIGSATAAANGSFAFTDTNAVSFPTRFYRLSLP
jgi:hypothetical protein